MGSSKWANAIGVYRRALSVAPAGHHSTMLAQQYAAAHFSARVRPILHQRVPGPCVLDATVKNMRLYSQGHFESVQKDVRLGLPERSDAVMRACAEQDVEGDYAVRRELINYKKVSNFVVLHVPFCIVYCFYSIVRQVCLHIWHNARHTERTLQQLSTFFFRDITFGFSADAHGDGDRSSAYTHSSRYTELCQALQQCKGSLEALLDARNFTKAICCVPRHPLNPDRPSLLVKLPVKEY